jgi:hypothetical protein
MRCKHAATACAAVLMEPANVIQMFECQRQNLKSWQYHAAGNCNLQLLQVLLCLGTCQIGSCMRLLTDTLPLEAMHLLGTTYAQ